MPPAKTTPNTPPAPPLVTIKVEYNAGAPKVTPADAEVGPGGEIAFECSDGDLLVVCQYNRKGSRPEHHHPFAAHGPVFWVAKGDTSSHDVKFDGVIRNEKYKYTIVVLPSNGARVAFVDPTIIIR